MIPKWPPWLTSAVMPAVFPLQIATYKICTVRMGESKSSAEIKALPEKATEMPPEADCEGSASSKDVNATEDLKHPV